MHRDDAAILCTATAVRGGLVSIGGQQMRTDISVIMALLLCVPAANGGQSGSDSGQKQSQPTITQRGLEVTDKTFTMSYEIRNDPGKDIWVMDGGGGRFDVSACEFFDADTQTIIILPKNWTRG